MKQFEGLTNEQLAVRYVNGDYRAFDELLNRTQHALFTYIQYVVHDEELANDIFQDTYMKCIVKLQEGRYAVTGKFDYWLNRIAHNVIMDRFRAQKNSHVIDAPKDNDLQNLHGSSLMDSDRESQLANEQVMKDVVRLMNALPAPQREVVYMRFYEQRSFKEIAKLTGVSINTSLGRMRYALLNLRRMAKQHNMQLALSL